MKAEEKHGSPWCNREERKGDARPVCDLFHRLGTHSSSCLPACLPVCRAPVLCGLIEVDCGIISLIKFFHFLRLSLLPSCRMRVAERRPSSPLSSGASHPPITADHCLNYSSLFSSLPNTHLSFTLSPSLADLSPAFSSHLIPNCSIHSSPLSHSLCFSLSTSKQRWERFEACHSYVLLLFCISSFFYSFRLALFLSHCCISLSLSSVPPGFHRFSVIIATSIWWHPLTHTPQKW